MLFRFGFVAARLVVAAFMILTAGYCLLAYIPFTFHQIHRGGLLPWLSTFADYHPWLYWIAFLAAAASLPNLRNDRTRAFSMAFLAVYLVIGVDLAVHPMLVNLQNTTQSLYRCLFALVPLVWLGWLDWRARRPVFVWAPADGADTWRTFWACLLAAIYTWMLSGLLVLLRYAAAPNEGFQPQPWGVALLLSLICHAVLFMAIFLALSFAGAIAALRSKEPAAHPKFYILLAVVLLALALKLVVFSPLSFFGGLATFVAFAVAFALVIFFTGMSVRFYAPQQGPIESPLALLFAPLRFLRSSPRWL